MRKRNLAGLRRDKGLVEQDTLVVVDSRAVVDTRAAEVRTRVEDMLPAEVVVRDKVAVCQTCCCLRFV